MRTHWRALVTVSSVMPATDAVPLMITAASDGPWAWRATRYSLREGSAAGEEHSTTFSREAGEASET